MGCRMSESQVRASVTLHPCGPVPQQEIGQQAGKVKVPSRNLPAITFPRFLSTSYSLSSVGGRQEWPER